MHNIKEIFLMIAWLTLAAGLVLLKIARVWLRWHILYAIMGTLAIQLFK